MLTLRLARLTRGPHTLRAASIRFYNLEQKGDKATPFDAASPEVGKHAKRDGLSGNQENIGFADQVGSQSASGSPSKLDTTQDSAGTENNTPPTFGDVIKKTLGMKTTAGEEKQNRGGGKGVTGTGHPTFDTGKRQFSTTSRAFQGDKGANHTAETYFKDVDSTQPHNPKVHQVDPSAGSPAVARANEQPVTGEFSRAGSQTKEYETASKHDKPYDTPPAQGQEADEKLRYGGKAGLEAPKGEDEGPAGKSKGGRS